MSDTTGLANLVNTDRVRRSIKRLFTNDISEVLGELFQNSQRAGATLAEITTSDTGFIYSDNGHGLIGGLDGLHILLKIAESKFDNETIEAQDPMGLGIHSLLAHDQVSAVRFVSGDLALRLDTKRWWDDPSYYQTWFERAEVLEDAVAGLRVEVECDSKLTEKLIDCLTKDYDASHFWGSAKRSPAAGYRRVLAITLNGQHVKSDLPKWAVIEDWMFDREYKGARLSVGGTVNGSRFSTVIWYGQLIQVASCGPFQFQLEVYEGRPVNPMSPSRRGLIEDEAYRELHAFIKEEVFNFVFAPENRARVKARWIAGCFQLDLLRAQAAPLLLAQKREPINFDGIYAYEDIDKLREIEIFEYTKPPLLLKETVRTDEGDHDHGLSTFLEMIGEDAYELKQGDRGRLKEKQLWWAPGESHKPGRFFCDPGEWGLGVNEEEPEKWEPVSADTVFCFTDPSTYDINETQMTVSTKDKVGFLQGAAWAGFDNQPDERDVESCQNDYQETLDAIIRELEGDAVPHKFDLWELKSFFEQRSSPIVRIDYHYEGSSSPIAITAVNEAGESKRLKLM